MSSPSFLPRRALGAAAIALGALALGACASAGGTPVSAERASTPDAPVATAPPVQLDTPVPTEPAPVPDVNGASRNAQLVKDGVVVHGSPSAGSTTLVTLRATTGLGSKTTLLVLDEQPGWVHVALPTRPNGSSGWVRTSDVQIRDNTFQVHVDLAARTITVTRDGQLATRTTVAVGAEATPTPTGEFYVTDLVENEDPSGAYGPYAIGLSAHSERVTEFAGGDGQIGIHGTNDPSSIGRDVSLGCVRLPNDLIRQLATSLPLGTPVTIS